MSCRLNLLIDWVNPCFVKCSVLNKIWAQVMGTAGSMGLLRSASVLNNGGRRGGSAGVWSRRAWGPGLHGREKAFPVLGSMTD